MSGRLLDRQAGPGRQGGGPGPDQEAQGSEPGDTATGGQSSGGRWTGGEGSDPLSGRGNARRRQPRQGGGRNGAEEDPGGGALALWQSSESTFGAGTSRAKP